MNDRLLATYEAARNASVPLVVLRTPDPSAAISALSAIGMRLVADGPMITSPLLRWDGVNGLVPLNDEGSTALNAHILRDGKTVIPQKVTIAPVQMLSLIQKAPEHSVVFMSNAHLFWKQPQEIQAVWNVRDHFKANYRMLVLMTHEGAQPPAEFRHDVITLDEPLPNAAELAEVVENLFDNVGQTIDKDTVTKAVEALSGLAHFPAEQHTAMNMGKDGLNVPSLWESKIQVINDTPGLHVVKPSIKFADIGGNESVKKFFRNLMKGPAAPTVLVILDEMGDQFSGVGSKGDPVSTGLQGKFLTHLSRTKAIGVLFLGHPGTGKTAIVEAVAAEFGIPMIALDFGDLKDSKVGESEARTAHALSVIDAVSHGRALYVGTSNAIDNITPQLQRRFNLARFFFDTPTKDEKAAIWPVYIKRPHHEATGPLTAKQTAKMPEDKDWTGDEIRLCAEHAWRFGLTLLEASKMVVPVAQSNPEAIDERRQGAANRYLSAAYEGAYQLKDESRVLPKTVPVVVVSPRAISGLKDMKES